MIPYDRWIGTVEEFVESIQHKKRNINYVDTIWLKIDVSSPFFSEQFYIKYHINLNVYLNKFFVGIFRIFFL